MDTQTKQPADSLKSMASLCTSDSSERTSAGEYILKGLRKLRKLREPRKFKVEFEFKRDDVRFIKVLKKSPSLLLAIQDFHSFISSLDEEQLCKDDVIFWLESSMKKHDCKHLLKIER